MSRGLVRKHFCRHKLAGNFPVVSLKLSSGVTLTNDETMWSNTKNYPLFLHLQVLKLSLRVSDSGHWLVAPPPSPDMTARPKRWNMNTVWHTNVNIPVVSHVIMALVLDDSLMVAVRVCCVLSRKEHKMPVKSSGFPSIEGRISWWISLFERVLRRDMKQS